MTYEQKVMVEGEAAPLEEIENFAAISFEVSRKVLERSGLQNDHVYKTFGENGVFRSFVTVTNGA